jgi:Uma2 family endonuclease
MLGVGTRVPISPHSLPQPDVYIQDGAALPSYVTDDALVLFEVLSKSNTKADRAWRKRIYASIPNCQHYVTVSTKSAEIIRHDRSGQWAETQISGLAATLPLPAIRFELVLADIYRWTPIQ